MAIHSKVRIFVHLIWGTFEHRKVLSKGLRVKIFHHLVERANELEITINKMNVQPDHVHILLDLPSDKTMAQVARYFKGECSKWINDNNLILGKFNWQRGYGAYSVSRSALERVAKYIEGQDEHHQEKSFSEEYREWAERYGVWDGDC